MTHATPPSADTPPPPSSQDGHGAGAWSGADPSSAASGPDPVTPIASQASRTTACKRGSRRPVRVPEAEELVLGFARASAFPQLDLLLRFLLSSGLRLDEALQLREASLDRWTRIARIGGRPGRFVTLSEAAMRSLDPSQGRLFWALPDDPSRVLAVWDGLRTKRLRFRLHDLRHAYILAELERIEAGHSYRAHADLRSLSRHVGHPNLRTTLAYRSLLPTASTV